MPWRALPPLALLLALATQSGLTPTWAAAPQAFSLELDGEIRAVRQIDLNGDGRPDLVVLAQPAEGAPTLHVLHAPEAGAASTWFREQDRRAIALDGELSACGALCVGRFGPAGQGRLRFLGPNGVIDLDGHGRRQDGAAQRAPATLMARSAGRALVFWDGVADLDGDGCDECWFPLAEGEGALFVLGGEPGGDRRLSLQASNVGTAAGEHALYRYAYVANLVPADLDGDGRLELLALQDNRLLAWSLGAPAGKVQAPGFSLELPFLAEDPALDPEEMRTPRLQIADVNGDGKSDLLVSLLVGRRDKLGSVRTILYHFPGPFRDATTGALVKPRGRIDTESVALHPAFVDLDGDGTLEYVGDSIRGTTMDLLARIAGRDSELHLVGYRLEGPGGTFSAAPLFTLKRTYASSEALSNRFGKSAWFEGDFDGDGQRDLLDLGNLESVEILRGNVQGKRAEFGPALLGPLKMPQRLTADARILDLDGDGRSDAVRWSGRTLHLLSSGGRR